LAAIVDTINPENIRDCLFLAGIYRWFIRAR